MKVRSAYLLTAGILSSFLAVYILLVTHKEEIQVSLATPKEKGAAEKFVYRVQNEESEVIHELITIMAHTNPALLPFKKSKLEALGLRLKSKVTTFEFLACVFSDPVLAKDMKVLQESSVKYKRFIEGLFPKMWKEYENEGFYLRAQGFARYLKIDHKEFITLLKGCIKMAESGNKNAFQPIIDYLIVAKAH